MIEQIDSPKALQIKDTAKTLFWKHGIRRVTVEEICQEAGVSKMTFYRMFDNKIELAKAVLDEVVESSLEKYRKIMGQDTPFAEKIRQMVLLKLEGTEAISQELIMDIYKNEVTELIDFMAEKRKQGMEATLQFFAQGQKEGALRKDVKPEFIMHMINQINDMATDEKLLAMYDSPQDLIMELTNFFFYGISSADEKKS
ncbi:AcrR family transcriptional regulator [Catalinimonas alkaloidigena]|uniref:TetR/AcrR family transcriptional regulator n=1 Tax=Catalinimonas alkaloidigena TaxID=1075417 RepID=UPI002406069F|nr:TetR/AcrR family transcriptional regulator [Catalinimonas alkaloidigena]MDF9796289.1 AcrR family transcriptional regulator [Catalinimonas alkaloidigena]